MSEREQWKQLEAEFYKEPINEPHVHDFKPVAVFDSANDSVEYIGRCECEETQI